MSIKHIFFEKTFEDGFQTKSAILSTLYKPEVLFVGTFNPRTRNAKADFFYGRNFFWPALMNLFIHREVFLGNRRMSTRGPAPKAPVPSMTEIFDLCTSLNITFADLIAEVLHNSNPSYEVMENDNIRLDGKVFNLIQDKKRKEIYGLEELEKFEQVRWNTQNIIKYLKDNPQIRSIYFTRRPTNVWAEQWEEIVSHSDVPGRLFTNIFTPSGAGLPVNRSMARLLRHWVHNADPNYGRLQHTWLMKHNVDLGAFL